MSSSMEQEGSPYTSPGGEAVRALAEPTGELDMNSEENDDNAARQEAPGDAQPRPWGVKEGFLGEADVMMDRKSKRV